MSIQDGSRLRDELITSVANPSLKLARSLHRRRVRYREQAILVEGVRAVAAAARYGVTIRALLLDAERRADIAAEMLTELSAASRRVLTVETRLFAELADTEHPQPIMAICDMPDSTAPTGCSLVLALDAVADPGNLGALIRSAAAAGADAVAVLPHSVDPWNAKAVRSSAGSIFAIPVVQVASTADIAGKWFSEPPQIVLADGDASLAFDEADFARPTILVVGGEAHGASDASRIVATTTVRIPMHRETESLNASVAGSVLLFEIDRQRRAAR